jgi:hypothetical protein
MSADPPVEASPRQRGGERVAVVLAELSIACLTALGWVLSYSNLQRLAVAHGYGAWEAALWPLTVDFLVLASTLLALVSARRGRGPTGEAWLMAGAATAATLAGNVLAAGRDPIACAMHAWPAVCMVAAWHLFFRSVMSAEHMAERRPVTAVRAVGPSAVPLGDEPQRSAASPRSGRGTRREAERVIRIAMRDGRVPTTAEVARATGRSERQARRLLREMTVVGDAASPPGNPSTPPRAPDGTLAITG